MGGNDPDWYGSLPSSCRSRSLLIFSVSLVRFPNGDDFTWNINSGAQSQGDFSECGSAKNNEQSFKVFKGDKHVVFQKDGWTYTTIYYCM